MSTTRGHTVTSTEPDAAMADQPWVLAIDFGTSYTVAASRIGDRPPEVIELGGERRIPSVVLVTDSGETHIGTTAINLGRSHPGRTVRRPKSRLGEPAPIVLGGRVHDVTDLVGSLLRSVYAEAIRHHGSPPSHVRLTHPATWNAPRRSQLRAAAATAGIADPVLVPEPVAAAISFMGEVDVAVGGRVLVYDLGGGTFDTAALEATGDGFVVIGRPGGDASIGGELFDELVARAIGEQLDPATYERLVVAEDRDWADANAALRVEARRAKEALSSQSYVDVAVPLPTGIERARLETTDLERIIRPHLESSAEILRETASGAGLADDTITVIHLVGGASRTPLVEEIVRTEFPGVEISRRGDPKSAVALGATHPRATPTSLAQNSDAARAATIDQPGPPLDLSPADATPPRQPRPGQPAQPPSFQHQPTVSPGPAGHPAPPPPMVDRSGADTPYRPNGAPATAVPTASPPPPTGGRPPGFDHGGPTHANPAPPPDRRPERPVVVGVLLVVLVLVAGGIVAFVVRDRAASEPAATIVTLDGDAAASLDGLPGSDDADDPAVGTDQSADPTVITDDPNDPVVTTVADEAQSTVSSGAPNAAGAASAMLAPNDLLIEGAPTGWLPQDFPIGPVGPAGVRLDNEICSTPTPTGIESFAGTYFDRIDDTQAVSSIGHEVFVFEDPAIAEAWFEAIYTAFEECFGGGANSSLRTLADGVEYTVFFSSIGLSPVFDQGDCAGRETSASYRTFLPGGDPSTSAPLHDQLHRVRSCGKNVSILTTRIEGEASDADWVFLGALGRRAVDLLDALPES